MDPEILKHYHAPQRDPVFTAERPVVRTAPRPFWPYVIYAAVLGAALVFASSIIVQRVQETLHVIQ